RTDVAGVTAALGALGDDDVDARVLVGAGLLRRAAQRGHQAARAVDLLDDVARRRAERVGDELHLVVRQRAFDLRRGGGGRPPEKLTRRLLLRQLRHAVLVEQLLD